jgi:hypothetical protein
VNPRIHAASVLLACSVHPWRGAQPVLRTLKARERRNLYLQALGYRYSEIAQLSASRSGIRRL